MLIHNILASSYVNGPGNRMVAWFQGCSIGCPGCSNIQTWPKTGGKEISAEDLFSIVVRNKEKFNIDGISFSGGQPLEQAEELYKILHLIKSSNLDIDTLVYSGRLISEVEDKSILDFVDIFIDGPYIASERNLNLLWRGSNNQKVYLLNDKIKSKMRDVYNLLDQDGNLLDTETGAEITISKDGIVELTGFSNFSERELQKKL